MTASSLLKLFIGITVLVIVCIPEWFKTKEGISKNLSCIDPCMMDSSYILPLICLLQENENKETVETAATQNAILSSITLGFYVNTSAVFICYPQRNTYPLSQELNAQGKLVNVSLNIRGKYFHYPEVESNFGLVYPQEEEFLSAPFSIEIHISNHTGQNKTMDQLLYQDLGVHRDFINVSLHFENQIPFYTRPLGVLWVILISLVFICGLLFIAYKVKQETTPLIDDNQGRPSISRLKEEQSNTSSNTDHHENYHRCGQEGQKNQIFSSSSFLSIIAEMQNTVLK